MHPRVVFLSLISAIFALADPRASTFNADLIKSYLSRKFVNKACLLFCPSRGQLSKLVKPLATTDEFMISMHHLGRDGFDVAKTPMKMYQRIAVVVDAECDNFKEFLLQCSKSNFFSYNHHWLVFTSTESTFSAFEGLALNINSDVKIFLHRENSNFTIFDLYNQAFRHGGTLRTTNYGFYNEKNMLVVHNENASFYWKRKNMTGAKFLATTVLPRAFAGPLDTYLVNDENREVNSFNRYQTVLLFHCRDFYNFSLQMSMTDSWGYLIGEGVFDGLVGAFQNKTVDIGGSPLLCKSKRLPFVSYGRPTWILRSAFIFRNPKMRASFAIFLKPLSNSVWMCMLVSMVLIMVILRWSLKTEEHLQNPESILESSWSYLLLFSIGTMCQQGATQSPSLYCGRIVTITVFLFSVLLFQFYSGSVVSYLLMKPPANIRSLADLLHSTLKAGCEDVLYNRVYFGHITDPVALELFHKKIVSKDNTSNFFMPEEGLKMMAKGGFAYHVELVTAYPIIQRTFPDEYICELQEVQMRQNQIVYSAVPKHSPFADMINFCMHLIAERGLMNRQVSHWQTSKPICLQSSRSKDNQVGLNEFYPALLALVTGVVLSLVILVFENVLHIKSRKIKRVPLRTLYPYRN